MAIRFAEMMALRHHEIDDAFMGALREQFTNPQIMELGTMIGLYLGVGRLVAVLDLERPACAIGGR
jgi:alkylhydroperoxidase family enzyme